MIKSTRAVAFTSKNASGAFYEFDPSPPYQPFIICAARRVYR